MRWIWTCTSWGVSEDRAAWLRTWIGNALSSNGILVRDLVAVVGRLSFVVAALERLELFLAHIYAWIAAVPHGAFLPPPVAVRLCLRWIALKLAAGRRRASCRHVALPTGEAFRTDAKAEGNEVAIGGWQTSVTTDPKQAKWFSVKLDEANTLGLGRAGNLFKSSRLLNSRRPYTR